MTRTYTYTIEEWALAALCDRTPVRIVDTGVVGTVDEIYVSVLDPRQQRRVRVTETDGRVHHLDLTYGALEHL